VLVRLERLPPKDVERVAEEVIGFLRLRRLLGAAKNGGWGPGPAYRSVLTEAAISFYGEQPLGMEWIGWNHVEVHRKWQGYFAIEAFGPPLCPRCRRPADEEACLEHMDEWFEGIEPTLCCQTCGAEPLIGDWVGDCANAFGAPAVTFWNWEELSLCPGAASRLTTMPASSTCRDRSAIRKLMRSVLVPDA
jgi:hypothetical protein